MILEPKQLQAIKREYVTGYRKVCGDISILDSKTPIKLKSLPAEVLEYLKQMRNDYKKTFGQPDVTKYVFNIVEEIRRMNREIWKLRQQMEDEDGDGDGDGEGEGERGTEQTQQLQRKINNLERITALRLGTISMYADGAKILKGRGQPRSLFTQIILLPELDDIKPSEKDGKKAKKSKKEQEPEGNMENADTSWIKPGQQNSPIPLSSMGIDIFAPIETIGKISPPYKALFVQGTKLPLPTGYIRCKKEEDDTEKSVQLNPLIKNSGAIEAQMPFLTELQETIPLPSNTQPTSANEDGLLVIPPTPEAPRTWKNLDFIPEGNLCITFKPTSITKPQELFHYKPSQKEQEYWKRVLPLPNDVTKEVEQNPQLAPEIILHFFASSYRYICNPQLGKLLQENADDLPLLMDELKMGHCDYLSWALCAYYRSIGLSAVVEYGRTTNGSGSAFIKYIGHARVVVGYPNGESRSVDPSLSCEVAEHLCTNNPINNVAQQLNNQLAQLTSEAQKRNACREWVQMLPKKPKSPKKPKKRNGISYIQTITTSELDNNTLGHRTTYKPAHREPEALLQGIRPQQATLQDAENYVIHSVRIIDLNFGNRGLLGLQKQQQNQLNAEKRNAWGLSLQVYRRNRKLPAYYNISEGFDDGEKNLSQRTGFAGIDHLNYTYYWNSAQKEMLTKKMQKEEFWEIDITETIHRDLTDGSPRALHSLWVKNVPLDTGRTPLPQNWPSEKITKHVKAYLKNPSQFISLTTGLNLNDTAECQNIAVPVSNLVRMSHVILLLQHMAVALDNSEHLQQLYQTYGITTEDLKTLAEKLLKAKHKNIRRTMKHNTPTQHAKKDYQQLQAWKQIYTMHPEDVQRARANLLRIIHTLERKAKKEKKDPQSWQLREYVPGDDLRRLDWKIYARTDKLYIKTDEVKLVEASPLHIFLNLQYHNTFSHLLIATVANIINTLKKDALKTGRKINIGSTATTSYTCITVRTDPFAMALQLIPDGDDNPSPQVAFYTEKGIPANLLYLAFSPQFAKAAEFLYSNRTNIVAQTFQEAELVIVPQLQEEYVENGMP